MKVPLIDISKQYEEIGKQIEKAVIKALRRRKYTLGPEVREFEREMAASLGVRHAVAVSSGSNALYLALLAAGVGPGNAVVTSPLSFVATASSIVHAGALPLFADIDPRTFNMDPAALARLVEEDCDEDADGRTVHRRTGAILRAVMPVHLYGQTADMDPILDVAVARDLIVVEDAAQALGAEYAKAGRSRPAGAIGDLGCLSFYPTKNLGGIGDGGMVLTQRDDFAERLGRLRNHGDAGAYDHVELGIGSRMDTVQAAALLVKFNWLSSWNGQRRRNAVAYDEMIADEGLAERVRPPVVEHENVHAFNNYTVRAQRRDELAGYLTERGIGFSVNYPRPLHHQPVFASLGLGPGSFPEAERAAAECLSLPIHPDLTYVQQRKVVDEIAAFYGG